MKYLILFISLLFISCDNNVSVTRTRELQVMAERCYFEGQKDALNNDIRIYYDTNFHCWRWSRTCWNDGKPTIFEPSYLKEK